MKPMSLDTSPEIERVWIEGIQRRIPGQRLEMAFNLGAMARCLAWQGLCRRYPNDSKRERRRRFLRLMYGSKLANEVNKWESLLDRLGCTLGN